MSKDKNHSKLELSRWLIDKYWAANEGMMSRASALTGLLGVELGFVGTLKSDKFSKNAIATWFLILASAAIVVSICFLVSSIRDKEFKFPKPAVFARVMKAETNNPDEALMDFLLSEDEPHRSLYRNLVRENKQISKHFTRGTNAAIVAQIALAIAFYFKWQS